MFLSCHLLVIAIVVICRSSSFFLSFFSPLSLSIGRFHIRATSATCSSSIYDGFSYFFPFFSSAFPSFSQTYTAESILSSFFCFLLILLNTTAKKEEE
jgi:hypothetical protein